MQDATRERFARTAERVAELQDARAASLEQDILRFVAPSGDERALDSGTGSGALAFALAPHVREVVGVDIVPELLEQARKRAEQLPNVTFVEGDSTKLPFEYGSFDLALLLIAEGVLILFLFWLMNCLTWDWDGGAMLGF